MSGFIKVLSLGLSAILLAATSGSDGDVEAYRVRIPVKTGGGSTVQRLAIPAAALAAAQTADLADLRVFDARGRAMPIARAPAAAPALRRDVLKAMPILGAADGLNVKSMSLRLDDQGRARVARVDGTVADRAYRSVVLGALFDARATAGAARSLVLDADVPAAQPVTFRVEASRDLSTWRTLGEKVVYRAATGDAGSGATMPLGMAEIERDYLKVTWSLASRPLSPVVVRQAVLLSRPAGSAAGARIDANLPPLGDARAIEFAVPFRTPIATIRIGPKGEDVVVPVRILGRDNVEQPWTLLGQGIAARRAGSAGDIALGGGGFRTLRIEADARTAGFTTTPGVQLGFANRDLLFLAAGESPYTLAAGREGTADTYLPRDSLMTQAGGNSPAIARVSGGSARVELAAVQDAGVGGRRVILWAVLLLATALLAALAWTLWRRNPASGPEDGARG